MPLEGERLVVEPTFRAAEVLMNMGRKEEIQEKFKGTEQINSWHNTRLRCDVFVIKTVDGRYRAYIAPAVHHIGMDLHTMGCSDAWGIEQESNALATLAKLVTHRQMKQYMLTGMFMERSKRSGIMYVFRRLKPTVALNMKGECVKIMCALCMHPIAHYDQSWAGAMCPTDDVIAHLMLMRGDEHMYWRRCNQHPPYRPEAGL